MLNGWIHSLCIKLPIDVITETRNYKTVDHVTRLFANCVENSPPYSGLFNFSLHLKLKSAKPHESLQQHVQLHASFV